MDVSIDDNNNNNRDFSNQTLFIFLCIGVDVPAFPAEILLLYSLPLALVRRVSSRLPVVQQ
jgi:hypothetical protein